MILVARTRSSLVRRSGARAAVRANNRNRNNPPDLPQADD